jgi:uncharacterized MnhB-related membrane protein
MLIVYPCLVLGAVTCGILAIRASRLLTAALWLAGLSALVSVLFYLMRAPRVAVIELSVGAGLVTVLFVFAIGIAGEEITRQGALVPRPAAWALGLLVSLSLGWFVLPLIGVEVPISEPSLGSILWEWRALDVWVQVVLIFGGVLGVLGLLAEPTGGRIRRAEPDPKTDSGRVQS